MPIPIAPWDTATALAELPRRTGALAIGTADRGAARHTGAERVVIAELSRGTASLPRAARAASHTRPIDVADLAGRTTALLIRSTRAPSNTGAAAAELTRRTGALAHTGAPSLALSGYADLPWRARALPGPGTTRDTDVFTGADLASGTAALAGAAGAANPDFTLTIDADLVGETAGVAAGDVWRLARALTDAIEAGLAWETGQDAGAICTALTEAAVGVKGALPTPAALAVDADLATGTVNGGLALRRLGAGLAAATPCASAALVPTFRAVLGCGLVIPASQTQRAEDSREADTQGASRERSSGMLFRQRNRDVIKTIGIHRLPFLCALAQFQLLSANTNH